MPIPNSKTADMLKPLPGWAKIHSSKQRQIELIGWLSTSRSVCCRPGEMRHLATGKSFREAILAKNGVRRPT